MATKKDLVEAHAFSRRRLVTAFVSGAPGGREVEPVRPGRVLIGGIALSVLLLAGAAIAGFLIGRPPAAWLEEGRFVISKDTGEQYVVLRGGEDPELQRVPNYVSAQLLLRKADLKPVTSTVRDKYIRTVRLGEDLGIEGAPSRLPDVDELVDDGWTACTQDRAGTAMTLQDAPQAEEVADAAFLVASDGRLWLIAAEPPVGDAPGTARRFELPGDPVLAGTIANELGFGTAREAPRVDERWLNLFAAGPSLDLDEFGVTDRGRPAVYPDESTTTDLSDLSIGDLVVTDDGDHYLLADEGPERLTPFAALVHEVLDGDVEAHPIEGDISSSFADPQYPEEWPGELPTARGDADAKCVVLHPQGPDGPARRALAHNPAESADPSGVRAGHHRVEVAPGAGAYVLSGSDEATEGGSPHVIDSKGQRYALWGPAVPDYLGYGEVRPVLVPSSWLHFFSRGVVLSTNDARRVPADAPEPAGDAAAEGAS